MSSIASQAPLLAAELNLKLVQSVITAMRAADMAVAQDRKPIPGGQQPAPRRVAALPRKIEPRQISHRATRVEPARVIHSPPRVEPPAASIPACDSVMCCQPQPASEGITLQPPWKVLPWPVHVIDRPHFKPPRPQPDILIKGLLIDIFV